MPPRRRAAPTPPPPPVGRRTGAQRRDELIALGREMFATAGYDDVAIEAIATRAGMSKGLLYHYFPTKRDYYLAVLRDSAARLVAAIDTDPGGRPGTSLLAALDAYLGAAAAEPEAYAALVRAGLGSDPEVQRAVDVVRQALSGRAAKALGLRRPRASARTALAGWVGWTEQVVLQWTGVGGLDRARALRLVALGLVGGLGAALRIDPDLALPDLSSRDWSDLLA